ncbi:PREDICTED: anion exchange protein 2-like [Priapulus caudatus]|uniref:Anion exchange protein n=1 Tax=Priapulus caudatus TaxID=37621 RepID=A0ABM1F9H0_PRICU|nr:PREDICTED: anion exchange protein 2-like [Priapulus caudatus]
MEPSSSGHTRLSGKRDDVQLLQASSKATSFEATDEDMEKILASPERFDVLDTPATLVTEDSRTCGYDEEDYKTHRVDTHGYQRMHHPMKLQKSHHHRRKSSKKRARVEMTTQEQQDDTPDASAKDDVDKIAVDIVSGDHTPVPGAETPSTSKQDGAEALPAPPAHKRELATPTDSASVQSPTESDLTPSPPTEADLFIPPKASDASLVHANFYLGSGTNLRTDEEEESKPLLVKQEDPDKEVKPAGILTKVDTQSLKSEVSPAQSPRKLDTGKVSFQIGGESHEELQQHPVNITFQRRKLSHSSVGEPLSPEHFRKSSLQHHHHGNKGMGTHLDRRRCKGSDVMFRTESLLSRINTMEAGAEDFVEGDKDVVHRYEDVRGIRRRKIKAKSSVSSVTHLLKGGAEGTSQEDDVGLPIYRKKKYDHSPHEIFVELDELIYREDENDSAWKETARWIKFEEDIQESADRWGKPHVPSLSFHSLLELRKCLEQGTVLLDLEEKDLSGVATRVVDNMVITDQIKENDQGAVLRALLLKHKRLNENGFIRRNLSFKNLPTMDTKKTSKHSIGTLLDRYKQGDVHYVKKDGSAVLIDIEQNGDNKQTANNLGARSASHPNLGRMDQDVAHNKHMTELRRKIPAGAEAFAILVGAVDFLEQPTIAFVRLAEVPWSATTQRSTFHTVAYRADDRQDILVAINEFLDTSTVLPPGVWDKKTLLGIAEMQKQQMLKQQARIKKRRRHVSKEQEGEKPLEQLTRTGRAFGGMVNDAKRRYPLYKSDIIDAFNMQCLATCIFIFFACLSPAITFAGVMSDQTDEWMGVSEMLAGSALGGFIYSIFSAQPLIILGATGPILVFEYSLYGFCKSQGFEFLVVRWWIGAWVMLMTVVTVALDGSVLVRYFTRFTEEIFAALISFIFIFACIEKLYHIYADHPLLSLEKYCDGVLNANATVADSDGGGGGNNTAGSDDDYSAGGLDDAAEVERHHPENLKNQPNTALMSTVFMIGTFFLAYFLKNFRNSKFLGRSLRRAIGDFGVPIAIVVMTIIDELIVTDTYTKKLYVPKSFSPTAPYKRGWVISPLGIHKSVEWYLLIAACIPAMMVYILIFMEFQISSLIVNKKERCLKKGAGFHLDMFIVGSLAFVCAALGLPWMCAATVRSVAHISSLTLMSRTHAPGEKPRIIDVKEQRVTNFVVSVLLGLTALMGPVLNAVPEAVLFGVFLYMGFSSLQGIQLIDRFKMLFMPGKHFPDVGYVKKVPTFKIHLFTIIQILCIGVLWAVKSSAAALAFPFVLLLVVPVRKAITLIFTSTELAQIDKEDLDTDYDDEDGPDFYEQAHMPM